MPLNLLSLPDDVATRIFSSVPLAMLPSALAAVQQTSSQGGAFISEVTWSALLPLVALNFEASSSRSSSRRSLRLVLDARATFAKAWTALLTRGEALHHAIVCCGQDSQDLSVLKVRQAFERWGPWPLVDRASPVYNSTLLMEVCRARGRSEPSLIAVCSHLIFVVGVDPCARPPVDDPCTALIIAACRGLPRLTSFLLACGADPRPTGRGRFRLCGRMQTLGGCYDAAEWTRRLLDAEHDVGVSAEERRGLEFCRNLLTAASGRAQPEEPARNADAARELAGRLLRDASRSSLYGPFFDSLQR